MSLMLERIGTTEDPKANTWINRTSFSNLSAKPIMTNGFVFQTVVNTEDQITMDFDGSAQYELSYNGITNQKCH